MSEDEKALSPKHTSTTWKPGQSGNPKGRASRAVEHEYLDIMMAECTPEKWATICKKAVHDAEKGDKFARDFLAGYMLGEPKKVHEYMVQENKSITIRVIWGEEPTGQIVDGETRILELTEGEEDE